MKKIKKKFITNIIFNAIALISTIVALIFCIYIYKLDMVPGKYLTIIFIAVGIIYLALIGLTLPRKMKIWIKGVCCFFFVVNALVFGYGIKYSDKTIEALDKINDKLVQKEDYEIKVLAKSSISTKDGLKGKKIGIFKNERYDDIIELLKKDVDCEIIDYDDPIKFFEDLQEGNIDAVICSETVYGLLDEDLSYMELDLKTIHTVGVPFSEEENKEVVKVVDVTNTPFNIYLAGGDKRGTINKVMNTDVNMIISVDPVNHKILLTSIPRDYYVVLPSKGENAYDKLTHAGYYGVQESIKSLENLLDIDINYYVKVNFTTVLSLVEAIDGIDVYSDYNFCQYRSKTMCYKKGWNHLTKDTVLPFARERKSFKDGDVQRVKNQQKVIDGIVSKMASSKTLLANYSDILEAISTSFATNLDRKSISRLVKLQLSDMRGWKSESQNLVGFSAMSTTCYSLPGWNLYVMKQDPNSVKTASDKIKTFMGLKIEETKEEIVKE